MDLDLPWDRPVNYRPGSTTRLWGIALFYDFEWGSCFRDQRAQFRHGQCLAKFVLDACPKDKTPVLLLTDRGDIDEGIRETESQYVFVVNLPRYREATADAALSYLARRVGPGITRLPHLDELADGPTDVTEALSHRELTIEQIAAWASADPARLAELRNRGLVGDATRRPNIPEILSALHALDDLGKDVVSALSRIFGPGTSRERRLELLRQVTADPGGREIAGTVLGERARDRVADARRAVEDYEALLRDPRTGETAMQDFIERTPWLLGLDYVHVRARQPLLGGTMDFFLERLDGFHDLLELKSPQDPIIVTTDHRDSESAPPASSYALSHELAVALAQVHVYRDRLTRHADATEDLLGLSHSRDPRLMIVIGRADGMAKHSTRILGELNRSLHRVEIIPYDLLALRAKVVLQSVDRYLLAAAET
ncbi:MAG TPA: Shedu anti-phage system protein SduA domain-containing protein [Candidatus Dormibacteraeota bacterium]|nr:Shedu anti-phage system protein SduA domain-containing protein [Candidatus Dormibacteraeota bacterium]